ncbi:hypothetical protein H6G81_29580 [Scytonema hofmannii FACHB-248]|uniref:Uncharacterized protein n=1 Tax=Scytonema hofmannii FACHB-248 TaxID=1842502 RepID=A0ABR8GYF4_9CYAN|nr:MULTISPECIES: hypothetical protein [Nostocales]MBD2608561.1 hypothetical protein [Scytonema hofmannii FACHB-248]
MSATSRYWHICRISLKSQRTGYEYSLVPIAQEFCYSKVPSSQTREMQAFLLSYFDAKNSDFVDVAIRGSAGFCLRCYVSEPILKACQKIDSLFSGDKSFTYKDLLPFVLNDDGKTPIILDSDRKTQLIVDANGKTKTSTFKFFTVEVLRTYNADARSMSLDNWVYLQTKQNSEVKDFLSEFGFQNLSDWALMNRARPKQIEKLSVRDRHLVEVFHSVYRRDRQNQRQVGAKRCPDPSTTQLQEMLKSLQQRGLAINTPVELTKELKYVATQLRQYDIWSYREPLEIQDPDTGNYTIRADFPNDSQDDLDVEQREIIEFLHEQLKTALVESIQQQISDRLRELQKSRKYASFAEQFIAGLQLYYCQQMPLKDVGSKLGMSSWDQTRRILNPGELLSKVRTRTVQQVIEKILSEAHSKGLTEIPPKIEYLKTVVEQIEAFADAEIFQEAAEEIRAGKSRSLDSLYAQELRLSLNNQKSA